MIGTLLSSRFRLEERLGSGGMSTVYRAFDETLERWVAIKLMHSEITSDPAQLERFRREARAVARLSHAHVVTVIDAGEDEGHPYIVFEHVEGETLKERIRRDGPLSPSEAVAYAIEIGRALMAAHEARLVHRDIKPQNVLIDQEGRAKVTDFGIARSLEAEGLTAAGKVLGTTDYVSPEQALGEDVTGQSDVYSLGICLYEMLSGAVPFRGETHVTVAMKHVQEPMPDVRAGRPEISASLAAIVERATAKERKNRYATAQEMVHDLEEALAIEAARAGEITGEATSVLQALPEQAAGLAPRRLLRPRRALVTTLVVVGLVAAGVILLVGRTQQGSTGGASEGAAGFEQVRISSDAFGEFDPPPGDRQESPDALGTLNDNNRSTWWDTETYYGGLSKAGVGLTIDAGAPVAARRLELVSPEPGWTAEVYAADTVPGTIADWGTAIGSATDVGETEKIDLDTAGQEARHYLLWITELPPGGKAAISELTLLQ